MFLVVLSAVFGLIHLYLWKRLVRDTTQPGPTRWLLTAGTVGLALLVVAALIGSRIVGPSKSGWFAWPGDVWFGLAAYLFLILLILEPVRLALRH